jgi:hypothetical protein
MSLEKQKYEFLSEHGFQNHFSRSLYFSRELKKLFSIEAIEDHDMDWLQKCVLSENKTGSWQFYFNQPVSRSTAQSILNEFRE